MGVFNNDFFFDLQNDEISGKFFSQKSLIFFPKCAIIIYGYATGGC